MLTQEAGLFRRMIGAARVRCVGRGDCADTSQLRFTFHLSAMVTRAFRVSLTSVKSSTVQWCIDGNIAQNSENELNFQRLD